MKNTKDLLQELETKLKEKKQKDPKEYIPQNLLSELRPSKLITLPANIPQKAEEKKKDNKDKKKETKKEKEENKNEKNPEEQE